MALLNNWDLKNVTIFAVRHYREYSGMEKIVKHIPRDHARWLGQRLSRLSEEQLKDCFRAAGYQPDEVDGYASVVRMRIAELEHPLETNPVAHAPASWPCGAALAH